MKVQVVRFPGFLLQGVCNLSGQCLNNSLFIKVINLQRPEFENISSSPSITSTSGPLLMRGCVTTSSQYKARSRLDEHTCTPSHHISWICVCLLFIAGLLCKWKWVRVGTREALVNIYGIAWRHISETIGIIKGVPQNVLMGKLKTTVKKARSKRFRGGYREGYLVSWHVWGGKMNI